MGFRQLCKFQKYDVDDENGKMYHDKWIMKPNKMYHEEPSMKESLLDIILKFTLSRYKCKFLALMQAVAADIAKESTELSSGINCRDESFERSAVKEISYFRKTKESMHVVQTEPVLVKALKDII